MPKYLLTLFLAITLTALGGCQETDRQDAESNPPQKSVIDELASGTLFSPGYRWTYQGPEGQTMYLETTNGKMIDGKETTKLRTKGASLFWSQELYIQVADGELRQIATGFSDSLFVKLPPPVLYKHSLTVGKQWHCKSESEDGSSSTEFTAEVKEQESITVPAGTFETLMVEYTLGFHFGTEQDLRIWFNDDVGIVKIERWQKSTLGNKESMPPIVYELERIERLADAHRIDYPSELLEINELPKQVVAPDGQLTLFADYDDVWRNQVVLYLVNKTDKEIDVPAQDNDLYVKMETQNSQGEWVRAQTHRNSWCGNSYRMVRLKPNTFITLLGFQPTHGRKQTARYKIYSLLKTESNVGELLIDERLIDEAKNDGLSRRLP